MDSAFPLIEPNQPTDHLWFVYKLLVHGNGGRKCQFLADGTLDVHNISCPILMTIAEAREVMALYGQSVMRLKQMNSRQLMMKLNLGVVRLVLEFGSRRDNVDQELDLSDFDWSVLIPSRIFSTPAPHAINLALVGRESLVPGVIDRAADCINTMKMDTSNFNVVEFCTFGLRVCDHTPQLKPINSRKIELDLRAASSSIDLKRLFAGWKSDIPRQVMLVGMDEGINILALCQTFNSIHLGNTTFKTSSHDPIEFQDQLIEAGLSHFARN